ncbi:retrovirus-related pol polyprotein from transposon TNT 1-94 [Tanacetum coccineum]
MIQVRLNAIVRNIKTDNGTEFVNQTLKAYYEEVEISHQTSVARTPQQNGVVKRRNRTLVEAARTMLIFQRLREDLAMASEQFSSGLGPKLLTLGTINSGLVPNIPSSTPYVPPTKNDWEILFQPMFDEYLNPPPYAPSSSTSQTTQETPPPVIPLGVEEADHDIEVAHMDNNPYVDFPIPEPSSEESSTQIEAMQEELNEFERLEVWELVPRLDRVMIITLKWIYKVKLDELGGVLKKGSFGSEGISLGRRHRI